MWIEIGHYAAILALLFAMLQMGAPVVGHYSGQTAWLRVGRQSAFVVFFLLTISSYALIVSFLNHDFSVKYVANHASLKLPIFYLVTAMWGGHEGSLLLWAWILAAFVAVAAWRHWKTHPRSIPWVLAILGGLMVGFLLLIIFLSSPFERLFPVPMDGRDLNPLLQDPGMVFHPPFLYMGYVGFTIPYAFAMAALINGKADGEWILATRRWTLFSWGMLTTGIIFGGYWAYYELGWGGYWAWDPVENASFMPWLTGTAFLHSVMVQERRGMFKTWNVFLIIMTFVLSILGTFLVRSGVLSSVHAFATDPGRGVYILMFMVAVIVFSFGTLVARSDFLQGENKLDTLLCRESAFLFNNLLLVVGAITVLLGTLYPLAIETFGLGKVSVGAPYYNKVFIPILLGIMFLMAIGPMIAYRKSTAASLKKTLLIPLGAGAAGVPVALAFGIAHPYGIATVALCFFGLATHGADWVKGGLLRAKKEGTNPLSGMAGLANRNKRRYGGLIVHIGILVMAAGFIGSGMFQEEKNLIMRPGESATAGKWTLTLHEVRDTAKRNWTAVEGVFSAKRGDDPAIELLPQKRKYMEHSQITTEAAIYNHPLEDIYVVLGDELGNGSWGIRIYRNPLVSWVWWGAGLMGLGAIFGLTQGRRLKRRKEGDAS